MEQVPRGDMSVALDAAGGRVSSAALISAGAWAVSATTGVEQARLVVVVGGKTGQWAISRVDAEGDGSDQPGASGAGAPRVVGRGLAAHGSLQRLPSRLARYYFLECERFLRYSATRHEELV